MMEMQEKPMFCPLMVALGHSWMDFELYRKNVMKNEK